MTRISLPVLILGSILIFAAAPATASRAPASLEERIGMQEAGSALLDAGENEKAAQFFERRLNESPGRVESAEGLIEARARLCRPDSAVAYCERALKAVTGNPQEILRLYLKGAAARLDRKFKDAALYFRGASAAAEKEKDPLSAAFCERALSLSLLAIQEAAGALEAAEKSRRLLSSLPVPERILAEAETLEAECRDAADRMAEADSLYREALPRASAKGCRGVESRCLAGLGRLADKRQHNKEAEEFYARSLSLEQSMGNKERIATLLNNLGQVEVRVGSLEAAAEHFRLAEETAGACDLKWILGYIYYGRGALAQARGSKDDALRLLQQSLALHKESGNTWGELGARLRLGYIHGSLGDYTEAIRHYEYVLKTYEDMKSLYGLSWTLGGLALAHHKLGDFAKADEYYRRALEVRRRLGDEKGAAWSLNSLGMIADMQGRYREALSFEHEAMAIYERIGDKAGIADVRYSMGSVYFYLGDYGEALKHYEEAFSIATEIGDEELLGKVVSGMSSAYSSAGRLDLAESLSEKCLALARKSKEESEIVWALNNLASIRIELGKPEAARECLKEALALLPAEGQGYMRGRALYLLAHASATAPSAIQDLERALALAEGSDIEELKWKCLSDLGDRYLALGDTAQSRSYQNRAIVSVESLRRLAGSDELRRHFLQPAIIPYERIVSLILSGSGRAADVKEAFGYTERCRAQILASLLREAMDRAGVKGDDKLLERERDILSRLTFYQARLQDGSITPEERAGLREKIEDTERLFVNLSIELERGDKSYVEELYPKVEQPDELLSTLAPDECVLSYFLGEKRSYLFRGKDKELKIYELPSKEAIEKKVDYFLRLLQQLADASGAGAADPAADTARAAAPSGGAIPRSVFDSASAELFEILLGAVAPELGAREKVIIIPDGLLGRLPFALLQKGGRYFVEDHDISYAPSLRTLRYLRERNAVRGRSMRVPKYNIIAIGASGEGGAGAGGANRVYPFTEIPIEPLRHAEEEAKNVASVFARSRVLTGRSAEESVFKGSPLDDTGIIHIAAHAYIDNDDLRRSFIVLNPERSFGDTLASPAEDGLLQWHEVAALKLNAALVTLSACRSAGGVLSYGEGITGLTQAFLYAGGGCVVAAELDVPDELAGAMMIEYYRNIRKGLGASAALSAAQRAALARTDAIGQPAVWGAFVAVGDGSSAPRLSRELNARLYAALLLLAAAAVVVIANILKGRRRI